MHTTSLYANFTWNLNLTLQRLVETQKLIQMRHCDHLENMKFDFENYVCVRYDLRASTILEKYSSRALEADFESIVVW